MTLAEVNAMFLVGDTLSLAHASYPNIRPHFVPSSADSSLFAALCEADSGSGECTFPSTVVLADNLACHGNVECNADTLHAIKLVDPITSTVVYYEYIDPPCVRLAFFDDGQTTQYSYGKQCADPTVASITGVACCSNATKAVLSNGGGECLYIAEATTYSTAEERCAALYTNGDDAGVVCPKFNHNSNPTMEQGASLASQAGCSDYQYHWTDESCQLKAQIDPSGHVNLIEDIPEDEDIREDLQPGAGNPFPVRWNAPTGASELTDGAQFPLMTATPIVFTPKFEHLTTDIQCATADGQVLLADSAENVEKCARLCSLQTGCTYFIFADPAGSKAGECHMEAVDSDDCGVGGTVADEFSLYKILSKGRKRKQQGISGVHKLSVNSCTAGCSPQGAQGACICPIEIETSAVYKDAAASLPPLARLRETLKEGALNPIAYGSGVYTQCDSAACTSQPGVAVYTVGSSSTPTEYDERTIFEFTDAPHDYYGQKRSRFLINRISTVFVGNRTLGFNFRNPPGFMPNAGEETRGHGSNWNSERSPFGHSERKLPHAQYETDALINHLHEHDNTAPFVAYRLIQRLTSSNPSPRYIKVVADAFATGSYEDLAFSGSYGDLKATVTAILLDREARSSTLDIDPTHGMIREPLLKVLHMMRSMEFQTTGKLEVMLHAIHNKIGQNAFQSPSVFNFYLPEFAPSGKIAERGLVAPESQLAITPLIIGYLNGMDSLIDFGLTKCRLGFGDTADGSCNQMYSFAEEADGAFSFKPSQASTPAAAVQELANLLTGGRLSSQTRAALEDVYETVLGSYPIDVSSAIATQSSTLWSRYAKRAIDMDGDRFSSCSYTGDHELEPPQSPWFELDLKTVHAVQTIVLTGARANTYGQARLNGMDVYLFTTERRTENIYEQRGSSGAWIGECTCPDGQTYNVGDQWNSCDSLECNGGVVTKACDITTNWQSPGAGYGVWCAPASTTNGSSPERPAQLLNTGTLCGSDVEVVDGQVTTRVHCHGASGNMIRIETPADPAGENGLEICDIEVHVLDKNASGVYLPAVEEKEALALKQTLKLISMAPEFHSTNENNYGATPSPRTKPPKVPSQNRPYKAVVVVFLEGGADSYNMLVPHSNCEKQAEGEDVAEGEMESYELYDDYKELRSEAMALTKAQLLQVTVNGTEQPCQTFGLHPDLDVVRDLYLDGDAALIANAGALVEPVTGAGYRSRYQHPINLPPSLFVSERV